MNEENISETELISTSEHPKIDSFVTPATFNSDIGAHVQKQVKFLFFCYFFLFFYSFLSHGMDIQMSNLNFQV